MGFLTAPIDKLEELLGHSPHPAIVMLPLGTFAASNVCDVLALATDEPRFDDAARISIAIGLVGAVGAMATGLRDYGSIPPDREPNHEIATTHGIGNAIAGTLFAASYLMRDRARRDGRRTPVGARLLGLAGGALGMYTAWLGGKLVTELGEAVQPVMDRRSDTEPAGVGGSDDDAEYGRARLEAGTPLRPE